MLAQRHAFIVCPKTTAAAQFGKHHIDEVRKLAGQWGWQEVEPVRTAKAASFTHTPTNSASSPSPPFR